MSDIRFNRWLHQSGTGGIYQDGSGRVGIGSSTPNEALSVIGDVSVTGTLNISDGGNLNNPSGIITTGTLSVDSIDGTLSVGTGTSISSGIITTGTLSVGIVTCTELFVNGTLLTGGPPDPVGTIVAWADSTPPTGWLECNGQSTTGYAELAAVVGANVPDLRAEFIRGWDNGRGVDTDRISAGLGIGSSQTDAFQGHKHSSGSVVTTQANANAVNAGSSLKFANNFIGDPSNDGTNGDPRTSSETRPSNIALMYIIKHTTTAAAGATSGSKINQGNTEAEVIDTGSDGHFKVTTEGTEKFRVKTDGDVGIGTDNPNKLLHLHNSSSNAVAARFTSNNSSLTGGLLVGWNGTFGQAYLVENADYRIGTNNSEKLRITSGGEVQIANGNLKFSTAGTGIDFSATADAAGMTSELLDDYEEGTFSPAIRGSGTSGSVTYDSRAGYYTKVGNKVTVWGFMDIDTVGSPTNTPWITGFPFAPNTNLNNQGIFGTVTSSGGITNSGYLRYGTAAGPYVYRQTDSGTAIVPISIISAGNYITFTATYFVV